MLDLIAPLEVVEYTSRHDPGPEKMRFWLRGLSARQKTLMYRRINRLPEEDQDAAMYEQVLRLGLVGWENGAIPFDANDMDRMLDALPHPVYVELGNELFRLSSLTEGDKKN